MGGLLKILSIVLVVVSVLVIISWLRTPEWHNWAGNQVAPTLYPQVSPSTKQELIDFVKKAAANHIPVHAVGSGHSWSDIALTQGYRVTLNKLQRVLAIDTTHHTVTVEAGITIGDLNVYLATHNLELPNQGAITLQTIGGALATATHGSGHTGTFSDFILSLVLIDGQGNEHVLSYEHEPEAFAAARVSLGALGIVYAVTLQCKPLSMVETKRFITHLDWVQANFEQLVKQHRYTMFSWNPYTDVVLVYTGDPVAVPITPIKNSATVVDKLVWGSWMGRLVAKLINSLGSLTPRFTDWLLRRHVGGPESKLSYESLASPSAGIKRLEEEIAVPTEQLVKVLPDLKKLLVAHAAQSTYILGGVLCRFVQADTISYLSPAAGRNVVYLSISTALDYKQYAKLYSDFEQLLFTYGGRPHWGKINFLDYTRAHALYGQNLDKFISVRKRLDPYNLFSNTFIERTLTIH